jgi:hypothetical protein
LNGKRVLKGGGSTSRFALFFCLLVALAWQSCLTQTHIHPASSARVLSSLAPVRADTGGGSNSPDTPATCPICQDAALSGNYVAADAVSLAAPAVAIAWYYLAAPRPVRRDLKSHAWNSRAPPAPSTLPTA